MEAAMKAVRFNRPVGHYSPGDVAGFDDKRADAYLESGAADPVEADPAEKSAQSQQPAKAGKKQ